MLALMLDVAVRKMDCISIITEGALSNIHRNHWVRKIPNYR